MRKLLIEDEEEDEIQPLEVSKQAHEEAHTEETEQPKDVTLVNKLIQNVLN